MRSLTDLNLAPLRSKSGTDLMPGLSPGTGTQFCPPKSSFFDTEQCQFSNPEPKSRLTKSESHPFSSPTNSKKMPCTAVPEYSLPIPGENFGKIFETWISDQNRDLKSLQSAATSPGPRTIEEEDAIGRLVASVLKHYEAYYNIKEAWGRGDVVSMLSPCWTSSTEKLFLWVGGWRPTMAVQLLYSKAGIQVESRLDELIGGGGTGVGGDLAGIDADQLGRVEEVHRKTVRREREILEEEAVAQEAVAGERMVRISQEMTEEEAHAEGKMEEEMKGRREAMGKVLQKADLLRMETLASLVGILRPVQAVNFLIAAAELHLRVHEFGMRNDACRRRQPQEEETSQPAHARV